jgi:hypothetical protein
MKIPTSLVLPSIFRIASLVITSCKTIVYKTKGENIECS